MTTVEPAATGTLLGELRTTWPIGATHVSRLLALMAAAIVVWTTIGFSMKHFWEGTWFHAQETRVNVWFEGIRTPDYTSTSEWRSALADTHIIIGLAILFAVFAVWRWRRWLDALFVVGALATQAAVFLVVTLVVDRQRPPVEQLDGSLPTASFPSGHTGASTAFYGALIIVALWHLRHRVLRVAVPVAIALLPVSVMAARLYRGMHYPSDVVAGFLNGIISIAIAGCVLGLTLRAQPQPTSGSQTLPKDRLHSKEPEDRSL